MPHHQTQTHAHPVPAAGLRWLWAVVLVALLAACLPTQAFGSTVNTKENKEAKSLVDSIGSTVFGFAWPTATYQSTSLKSVLPAKGGFDAVVRLRGVSAWGEGRLWVDLKFVVRNKKLTDIRVRAHNAKIAAPFATVKTMGLLVAAIANDMQNNNGKADAGAVTLVNNTKIDIKFKYRWGNGAYRSRTLRPGRTLTFWHNYKNSHKISPPFQIAYDYDFAKGYQGTTRTLKRFAVSKPVTAGKGRRYVFNSNGKQLGLAAVKWQAGWPHPYMPNVVASATRGSWKPANGYRWFDTNNKKSLLVVQRNRGIIGVTFQIDPQTGCPKVQSVVKNSPADKAGIRPGNLITAVNGKPTRSKTARQVSDMIAGPAGRSVSIDYLPNKASSYSKRTRMTRK